MAKVLVIADTQNPFVHFDYLDFLKAVRKKYRTEVVVHVGDEIDHHALSDFETDPDGYSAGHELSAAIVSLRPYYRAFPEMLICESNHTSRIFAKAFRSGIPRAYLKDYQEFLEAPKTWAWKDRHEIDNVVYIHGIGYSGTLGAINAAKDNLKSCVIGHLHADAGILYWNNGHTTLFGMNVGSGIDNNAYAFRYGKKTPRKKSILSCGVVLDGRPLLIEMRLNKHGRWDGKL